MVPGGHWQGRWTADQGGRGGGTARTAIAKAETKKRWGSILAAYCLKARVVEEIDCEGLP